MRTEEIQERSQGTLYLKMDVLAENGASFRLTLIGNILRVFPSENFHLGDFMRFFKFIIQEIDPEAELVLNEEE